MTTQGKQFWLATTGACDEIRQRNPNCEEGTAIANFWPHVELEKRLSIVDLINEAFEASVRSVKVTNATQVPTEIGICPVELEVHIPPREGDIIFGRIREETP